MPERFDNPPCQSSPCRKRAAVRSRGVAMMLVVVALAAATMLAVPFLIAQGTSAAVGRNINEHARAQALAESGVELVLAYIHENPEWRTTHDAGVWFAVPYGRVMDEQEDSDDRWVRISVANEEGEPGDPLADAVIFTSVGRFDGTTHTVRTRVSGDLTSGPGLMPYGLMVADEVEMGNNSRIDAIDSRHDNFHRGVDGSATAVVATNATADHRVNLSNQATIAGDVRVGVGTTNPGSVVNRHHGITGSIDKLAEPLDIAPVTLPASLPPSTGDHDMAHNGQTTFTAGTYHVDDLTLQAGHTLRIEGDVTLVADETFNIGGHASIVLQPGATLKVYAETMVFEHNSTVNYPTVGSPADVQFFQQSDSKVEIKNRAAVAGVIFAPDAELEMTGNVNLFGGFQGQHVKIDNHARFTQDLALTAGGGGGSGASDDGYHIRWLASE